MTANPSPQATLADDDRSFYANLWGNTSRATRSRQAWSELRAKSGLLAVIAFGVLVSYLAAGVLVGQPEPVSGVTAPQADVTAEAGE